MDEWEFTLADVQAIGDETFVAEFDVPPGFTGYPGQFVRVTAPEENDAPSSFYTICSPYVTETACITFDTGPDSTLGRRLLEYEPGTRLPVTGPAGVTCYTDGSDVVILARGPGIGAAMGVGERAVAEGHQAGVVYEADTPAGREQLATLSETDALVTIATADLDKPVARAVDAVDGSVFVFGYDEFVDRATNALGRAGVDPSAAHVSNYG